MQIPVLIEPLAASGFRASAGQPFNAHENGRTAEEAVQKLKASLNQQLQGGKTLIALDFEVGVNPWLDPIGAIDPNDPLTKEWKEEMAAHRLEFESDPNRP